MTRRFGRVDVFATTAIKLDGLFIRDIAETDGKERLRLAQDSGTSPEIHPLEFLELEDIRLESDGRNLMHTIFARPRAVTIHRAWMRPYNRRA